MQDTTDGDAKAKGDLLPVTAKAAPHAEASSSSAGSEAIAAAPAATAPRIIELSVASQAPSERSSANASASYGGSEAHEQCGVAHGQSPRNEGSSGSQDAPHTRARFDGE